MLYELALQFRYLQLFAHNGHNMVQGATFFEDHEHLGGLYATYETAYDATVERMIGLGEKVDLVMLNKSAADLLPEKQSTDPESLFSTILSGEAIICSTVEKCFKKDEYTQGTLNLLAQFADDSETRIYKLQQRLK